MEFVGHIVLNTPLPCHGSCLNKKIEIIIGQHVGHLYTPILKNDIEKESLPYLSEPFPQSTVKFNQEVNWGRLVDSGNNISSVETLKFVFNIVDEKFLNDPDKFIEDTDRWLKRFEENLFPLYWILYLGTIRVEGEMNHNFKYYFKNYEAETQDLYQKHSFTNINLNIQEKDGVNLKLLKKIVRFSNQNKEISIDYRLLRDAHKCFLAGDYRESILYIGTCLDILLDTLILERLPTRSKELKRSILKGNRTIFKKLEIIQMFGPKIKGLEDVQKKISNIRNDVIHAGFVPSETECLQSYTLIAKLMIENQKRIYV